MSIDIKKLTINDVGRRVVYEEPGQTPEYGELRSWNHKYINVRYGKDILSHSTNAEYSRFVDKQPATE